MINKKITNAEWLSSKEAKFATKLKDCDLMHYRVKGSLKFEKRGNAFFYSKDSLLKLNKNK